MLCFEGHHVTTLGEITSKDGNRTEIHELESISRVVQEGKAKVNLSKNYKDWSQICSILLQHLYLIFFRPTKYEHNSKIWTPLRIE